MKIEFNNMLAIFIHHLEDIEFIQIHHHLSVVEKMKLNQSF